MAATAGVWISLSILLLIAVITIIACGIRIIQPHQKGLVVVLGSYKGIIDPGFHLVVPMITRVIPVEMRLQNLPITNQNGITKDGSIISIDLVVLFKIADPYKAHLEVQNYHQSIYSLVNRELGSIPGKYSLNEILTERELFREELTVRLNDAADTLGICVDHIELRNIQVIKPPETGDFEQQVPIRVAPVTGRESIV